MITKAMSPAVQAELDKQCSSLTGSMLEVCRYATQGGRGSRASLLLSAAAQHGSRAVQAAAALELIHAATLLQDDIFDGGRMRRGRATAHLRFGKPVAVLASDWLLIRSLEIAAGIHPHFFRSLAQAGAAMAEAEACELEAFTSRSMDEALDISFAIAKGKTAMLFGAALCGAALLTDTPPGKCSQWEDLGMNLGLTYQLLDDCVDIYGTEAVSGKTLGGDLAVGRLTLPVLLAMNAMQRREPAISLESMRSGRLSVAQASALDLMLHGASVQSQLQGVVQRRLVSHRRAASKAGINTLAIDACILDLEEKLATCFPRPRADEAEQLLNDTEAQPRYA